jgi:sugar phosphate isomerase/epimerase
MNIDGHNIGVCSWSLGEPNLAATIGRMKELGLEHMQLALNPLLRLDDAARAAELAPLNGSGIQITATMIGFEGEDYSTIAAIRKTGGYAPDAQWPARRKRTVAAADLTRDLNVKLLSTHLGFVPPSNHESYPAMLERLREVSEILAERGLEMAMETGQERASELLQFLNDLNCRNMGVNFDPANMILYGAGDPIEAVGMLGRHIRHVHIKDAVGSDKPGVVWGKEVPFGTGQVGPKRFLAALKEADYRGPLVIEREGGPSRIADVRAAVEALKQGRHEGT